VERTSEAAGQRVALRHDEVCTSDPSSSDGVTPTPKAGDVRSVQQAAETRRSAAERKTVMCLFMGLNSSRLSVNLTEI
jgi:hypothetical protein